MNDHAGHYDRVDQKLGEALRELHSIPFNAPNWIRAEAEFQIREIADNRIKARKFAQLIRTQAESERENDRGRDN